MENNNIKNSMTGSEKVLWTASFQFHLASGKTEAEASKLADDKIVQKREMAKTLTFKY